MDILISSNLERLLYTVIGTKKTAEHMKSLAECGRYELAKEDLAKISEHFIGYYTDESDTILAIKNAYENKKRLIDTHTAVAYNAAKCYMSDYKAERRMLVVSTASAYKFAADVYKALTGCESSSDLDAPYELESYTGVAMPSPISALRGKPILHDETINASDMEEATLAFAD
jgi:threonine synthase